jgi:AraC family transcriptional regulator
VARERLVTSADHECLMQTRTVRRHGILAPMSESYRPHVERALRYIADHLERPLSVAEVAKTARLSTFHFHRIFSAVMGEPVGRYITRKRLEVAALRLAYEPDRSVTEIGDSCGYSSTSNFTKAFTAYFGVSPTRVRRPNPDLPVALGKLTHSYGKRFQPVELHALPPRDRTATENSRIEPARFETCPGLDIACLASAEGYDFDTVSATWADLIDRARQLGICDGPVDAYGIAFDSPQLTAPEFCRYHACVPCPREQELPAPLFRARIPQGRYAVFAYSGEVAGVEATYHAIYADWFPRSSLAPDDFTAVDHYVHDWPVDGRVTLEIWIKVRARRSDSLK